MKLSVRCDCRHVFRGAAEYQRSATFSRRFRRECTAQDSAHRDSHTEKLEKPSRSYQQSGGGVGGAVLSHGCHDPIPVPVPVPVPVSAPVPHPTLQHTPPPSTAQ